MSDQNEVYERLAVKLDQMPNGFPAATDRAELDLLRCIFTPEEAALAVALPSKPASAETMAQLLDKPVAEIDAKLDRMCKQGQISQVKRGEEITYAFMPWLPGVQEGQLCRRDRTPDETLEFVRLWERYLPTFSKVASYGPHLARVVPVSQGILSEARAHRLEDVHRMLDNAKSFYLTECVCRRERRLMGRSCNHLSEVCLAVSGKDDKFDGGPEYGRLISREEAHRIMDQAEDDGLVHQTWNTDSPSTFFICNCCPCCCLFLRQITEFGQRYASTSSFQASIDMDECVQCADCLDERCAVRAIAEEGGEYSVDQTRCIGCGVCTLKCPADAIRLNRRPGHGDPPSRRDWAMQREANRPSDL